MAGAGWIAYSRRWTSGTFKWIKRIDLGMHCYTMQTHVNKPAIASAHIRVTARHSVSLSQCTSQTYIFMCLSSFNTGAQSQIKRPAGWNYPSWFFLHLATNWHQLSWVNRRRKSCPRMTRGPKASAMAESCSTASASILVLNLKTISPR